MLSQLADLYSETMVVLDTGTTDRDRPVLEVVDAQPATSAEDSNTITLLIHRHILISC